MNTGNGKWIINGFKIFEIRFNNEIFWEEYFMKKNVEGEKKYLVLLTLITFLIVIPSRLMHELNP